MNTYIHDAIYTAGLYGIGTMLIGFGLMLAIPWIWRKTRYARFRVKLWAEYRKELALIKRDTRRYKAAMRVFDKPLKNWSEK